MLFKVFVYKRDILLRITQKVFSAYLNSTGSHYKTRPGLYLYFIFYPL
jgi:hypothetical protein